MDDFDPHNEKQVEELISSVKAVIQWDTYDRKVIKCSGKHGFPDGEWCVEFDGFHGTHLGGKSKDHVKDGRHRAALFIYLYKKDIDWLLCSDLTKTYWNNVIPVNEKGLT